MEKICVAIRVYSRISDLECLIEIINKTWKCFDYDILVISNGESSGFIIPDYIHKIVKSVISLHHNGGHMSGSSQLLLAFWDNVNFENYKYCVIIEADTWMYGDSIIERYKEIMEYRTNIVYAGAKWYNKYYSLATDFAIIKTSFLKNNRSLFYFKDKAECHMANYIIDSGKDYIYIKENMMPNLPSYIHHFPYSSAGRLNCFPRSKTITHHIEHLTGGLQKKKRLFNVVSKSHFFQIEKKKRDFFELILINMYYYVTFLFLRKTWYSKTIRSKEDY